MSSRIVDPIRILMVNDDNGDLNYYKDSIENNARGTIEIFVWGPDQADGRKVARTLLKSIATNKDNYLIKNSIDVIFVDYRMPDMNGFEFLRQFRKLCLKDYTASCRLPIVMMTKYESQLMKRLESSVNRGIGGYVFTDRDNFWLDVKATATRVHQESVRERLAESLMMISSQLSTVNSREEVLDLIITTMNKMCPNMTVFIRDYDPSSEKLKLLRNSINVPKNIADDLYILDVNAFPMLKLAINGEVFLYNNIAELYTHNIDEAELNILKTLNLDRGMSFPLKNAKNEVFGTITIYREEKDGSFTVLEKNYAQMMVSNIAESLENIKSRQQGVAYTKFVNEFASINEEDALLTKMVKHIHESINSKEDQAETKTTYKKLIMGTDKLYCDISKIHHLGAYRDNSFMPSVFDENSVTARSARENRVQIIHDFSLESKYSTTNENMVSEISVPIAREYTVNSPVYGVVNLESSKKYFYNDADLDYTTTLAQLVGYYIDRLRTRAFLRDVLKILGQRSRSEKLISDCIRIIKKYVGYRLLLFVLLKDEKWVISNCDVHLSTADNSEIVREIENVLNKNENITMLEKAFNTDEPYIYVPDLDKMPEGFHYHPNNVVENSERLRSQAVFLMRSGSTVVGGLSLEFVINNPLTREQIDLLVHLANWLGQLILTDRRYNKLSDEINELDRLKEFTDFMGQVWHNSDTLRYDIRNLLEDMKTELDNTDHASLLRMIEKAEVALDDLAQVPNNVQAVTTTPNMQYIDVKGIVEEICRSISNKLTLLKTRIINLENVLLVHADANILKMILFHIISNAVEACSKKEERIIHISHRRISNSEIELLIKDTGTGLSQEAIDRATDIKYTTKSKGTGYGLYWVSRKAKEIDANFYLTNRKKNTGAMAVLKLHCDEGK